VDNSTDAIQDAQQRYFAVTDDVPEQVWYWAALASVALSAALKLTGKDTWALFVGQWPPTFLALAIFHKLLRPSR